MQNKHEKNDRGGNSRGGLSVADKTFPDHRSHRKIQQRKKQRISTVTEHSQEKIVDRNTDFAENQRACKENEQSEYGKHDADGAEAFPSDDLRPPVLLFFVLIFFVILFQGVHLPFIPSYYNIFFLIYQLY